MDTGVLPFDQIGWTCPYCEKEMPRAADGNVSSGPWQAEMSKRLHLHGCRPGTTLKQALVEYHKKYGRKFVGGEWKEKNRRGKFWLRGIGKTAAASGGTWPRVHSAPERSERSRREGDHESLPDIQTGDGHERVPNSTVHSVARTSTTRE